MDIAAATVLLTFLSLIFTVTGLIQSNNLALISIGVLLLGIAVLISVPGKKE